ncbi:MAG TPA: lantibiotic dehydratase [Candidatus Limnocylindrales bacterium]|nr:lantibiotic dehydratase [Candidatus Limnocylindrales bacterium]
MSAEPVLTCRVPALPARVARELYEAGDPLAATRALLLNEPAVRAAIAVASPALDAALEPWTRGEPAKKKRAPYKALAYALRMASRPTPFGLFAGIGEVARGARTTLRLADARYARLSARADMGRLHALHDRLERDPSVRDALTAVANDLIDERAGKLQVRHPERLVPGLDETDPIAWHYDLVEVRRTATLERVLDLCARPAPLAELAGAVAAGLGIERAKAAQLLERLIGAGAIVFSRPTALADPLPALADALPGQHPLALAVRGAADALRALEATPPDETTSAAVRAAAERLDAVHEGGGAPLQIDRFERFDGELGEDVVGDALRLAGLLMASAQPRALDRYRTRFRERYEGEERLVPLLELVDPELGIGVPENTALERTDRDPARDELRLRLAARALRERSAEVVLTDAELALLHPGDRAVPPANGCEIGFQVAAASTEAVRAGEYALRPVFGLHTDGAVKTVSRFAGGLGPAFAERLREADAADEEPGTLAVDLVYLPHDRHYANLLRPAVARPVIASQREELPAGVLRIEPRDIVIGVEDGRFVAYARSLGRRLRICETYMLSTAYFAPAHIRLLSLIGKQDRVHPRLFDWGAAAALPHLPRVRHGRLVLAVAQWSVPRAELAAAGAQTRAFIDRWRAAWGVPRWVYLVERDLKLLLDLESAAAPELLREHVAPDAERPSGLELRFEEMFPSFDQLWLERGGERFLHEFTLGVPGRGSTAPAAEPRRLEAAPLHAKGPGSEWTFVKLYAPRRDLPALLCGAVADLVAATTEHAPVDRWFFLHYGDPRPHLRLRLHHASGTGRQTVAALAERLEELLASGAIERYAFDTYRPELERYGGAAAIGAGEVLFHHDSRRVLDALRAAAPGTGHAERAIATAAPLLRGWFEAFDLAGWMAANERAARSVRVDWALVRRVRELLVAAPACDAEERRAIGHLAALNDAGRLTVAPDDLLASLLHLHFNRAAIPFGAESALVASIWQAWHGLARAGRAASERSEPIPERRLGGAVRTPVALWRSKESESQRSSETGSRNPS